MPAAIGPDGLLNLFARVFALLPGLKGKVLQANIFGQGVYIEVRLSGTLAGRTVTRDACDRFWFKDGLVIGLLTYLDPLPLFSAVARRPSAWRRWWRSGLGRRNLPSHTGYSLRFWVGRFESAPLMGPGAYAR